MNEPELALTNPAKPPVAFFKHGWLVPYLLSVDEDTWRRWKHWYDMMLAQDLIGTIPQIQWQKHPSARKMLEQSLSAITRNGDWTGWGSWRCIDYLFDWLLYGFGHSSQTELPEEPEEGACERLYQTFNLGYLLTYPHDYFGDILADNRHGRQLGFFPTPMDTLLITAFLLLLLVLLPVILRGLGKTSDPQTNNSYVAVKPLLTPAERSFFGVLSQATGNEYQIFAKVRLADIIQPADKTNRSQRQSAFNRISSKHVDFVICNSADLSVAAVVELDDSSHARPDRKERDSFIDSALTSARIPILHVPASQSYSPAQLSSQLETLLRENQPRQVA